MTIRHLDKLVAAVMALVAELVVAWLAFHGHEAATGALIGLATAGGGFYLRAKMTEPKE